MKPREMAARIAAEAPHYPVKVDFDRRRDTERTKFSFGTFKVSCLAYQEAVRDMAAKLAKGYHRKGNHDGWYVELPKGSRLPSLRRPPDADQLLADLEAELGDKNAYSSPYEKSAPCSPLM